MFSITDFTDLKKSAWYCASWWRKTCNWFSFDAQFLITFRLLLVVKIVPAEKVMEDGSLAGSEMQALMVEKITKSFAAMLLFGYWSRCSGNGQTRQF